MDKLKRLIELKEAHQNMNLNEDDYIGIGQVIDEAIKREEFGDKEKPMKVKTTFGGWLNCPACDMDISDYDTHDFTPGYCPGCGQAIDWEEATK